MLTWSLPVNEIKVRTWRRETVQTSSDGGALLETARKLNVYFLLRERRAVVNVSFSRRAEGQKCRRKTLDWTEPSLENNKARREVG